MRVLALVVALSSHVALACLCGDRDFNRAVRRGDSVFVGTVVTKIDVAAGNSLFLSQQTLVEVQRVWNGTVLSYAVLESNRGCWPSFEAGEQLLFYVSDDMVVGSCDVRSEWGDLPAARGHSPLSVVTVIAAFVDALLLMVLLLRRSARREARRVELNAHPVDDT